MSSPVRIILTILILFTATARAQDATSSITGTVSDAVTGELLIGANVLVPGTTLGAASDVNGNFTIRNVPAGTYRLQVSMIGYKPVVLTDVVVSGARPARVTAALQSTTIDLEAVTVEADYFTRRTEAPVSAQSLSNEEIRRAPGGLEDVVRAISVLPGVVQVSAGRNDLIVRGGAASENLYVVDNLEIPNINHFGTQGATGGPLSFINLDYVQDVTFSTGGFGARYGDKLSSVMNITLQEGRRDRIGGKLNVSASQFGLNTEGPIGSNGSFLFSARRSYLDLIFKAAGFGFVPEYWDFLGKASYEVGKGQTLSLLMIGVLDKVRFFNDTEDQRYSNSRILGNSQDQYMTGISYRQLLGNGFLTFTLGRSFVDYDFLQSDSLQRPLFTSASREGETSLRGDGVFLFGRHEVSFGVQGRMVRTRGDLYALGNPFFEPSITTANVWDTTGAKASAYVQLSRAVGASLRATIGLRADYFSMIDQPVVVGPRASLSYELSPLTTVSLSGGLYHQSPSTIWLVSNPLNTRLSHIAVTQGVLGVEHLVRSDTRVRVEGYVKSYADYPASELRPWLVMANTGAGFGGAEDGFASFGFEPLTSVGTGISRGVELLVQKRLSDVPLYGILSLSWNRTDFTAIDGVERPGSFDQRVIMNLSGGYRFDEHWEVAAKFRFGTGRPYTPYLFDPTTRKVTPDVARWNAERLPDFHALDVRIDRRWLFSSWTLITYIDIQNVYNRDNVQEYRWDFRNNRPQEGGGTIGILPSIGISAEF